MYLCLVLRPKDNNSPSISQSFQISPHSFDNSRSQNIGSMSRELYDIFTHLIKQQCSSNMIIHLGHSLDTNDVRMQNRQFLLEFKWDWNISFSDVLVRLE